MPLSLLSPSHIVVFTRKLVNILISNTSKNSTFDPKILQNYNIDIDIDIDILRGRSPSSNTNSSRESSVYSKVSSIPEWYFKMTIYFGANR